jgi:hypothetical protein
MKDGVVIAGAFWEHEGTGLELVKKADCKTGPVAEGRWQDLAVAVGPDKGYVCEQSSGGLVMLLPGSFDEACAALEGQLQTRGYHRRKGDAGPNRCAFIKDASTAYFVRPHEALAAYPVSWSLVKVSEMW